MRPPTNRFTRFSNRTDVTSDAEEGQSDFAWRSSMAPRRDADDAPFARGDREYGHPPDRTPGTSSRPGGETVGSAAPATPSPADVPILTNVAPGTYVETPLANSPITSGGATALQVQQALDDTGLSVNGSGITVGV